MASKIPGYQLIRKVGEGGMSTVYLAIQLSVGREVALKVLSPHLRSDDIFAERFYREANIIGRLRHPNIIAVYDIGRYEQNFYMAMDYLAGGNCKALLKQHAFPVLQAISTVRDINNALEHVHQIGYLHCDIKPENVMFRTDGSAVLTDFGVARDLSEDTSATTIAGTPNYMSPEQAQGLKLDKSADIYSLGILFFELLTGRLPYSGKDAISLALQHISAPIPELSSELAIFQPLLQRMMAKKPGMRFQNCHELKHALDFFEAQYQRQSSGRMPLKLQLQFFIQQFLTTCKHSVGQLKRLRFSVKHGLLLKLVNNTIETFALDAVNHTIHTTQQTQTNISELFGNDSIAIGLASKQLKRLAPTWLLAALFSVVMLGSFYISHSGLLNQYINSIGSPTIIYID